MPVAERLSSYKFLDLICCPLHCWVLYAVSLSPFLSITSIIWPVHEHFFFCFMSIFLSFVLVLLVFVIVLFSWNCKWDVLCIQFFSGFVRNVSYELGRGLWWWLLIQSGAKKATKGAMFLDTLHSHRDHSNSSSLVGQAGPIADGNIGEVRHDLAHLWFNGPDNCLFIQTLSSSLPCYLYFNIAEFLTLAQTTTVHIPLLFLQNLCECIVFSC